MRDLKRLAHNWVAVVVVLGIMVLPALYAWFNIGANMDPYSNTGNIKVGVVCDDKGAKTKQTGELNIGEQVVENLKKNDDIGWEFVSRKEADKGIRSGRYYATIIIPETFTEDMISFIGGKVGKPVVEYYVNEKKNAIAPKVTGTAASTVQREIDESFIEVVADTIAEALGDSAGEITSELAKSTSQAVSDLESVEKSISAYQTVIANSHRTIASNKALVADSKKALQDAKKANNEFIQSIQDDPALTPDMKNSLVAIAKMLNAEIAGMSSTLDGLDKSMTSLDSALSSTSTALATGAKQIKSIESGINAINSSKLVAELVKINGMDADEIAEFMKEPIQVDEKVYFAVRDYGSGMTPFYTMLAIWVGGIILLALFRTEVDKEGIDDSLKPSEAYLGRWLLLVVLGVCQSIIVCLGDIIILRVQCVNPLLFMLTGIEAGIVFVSLIYAFATSFRHIGKALVIILAILQIPGSSGTYPIEMTGNFFRVIHPLLPFTYGIGAMREAIAGTYRTLYIKNMLLLAVFFLLAMFIGLVIRYTVLNLNRMLDIELGATGLMETEIVGEEYPYERIQRIKEAITNDDEMSDVLRKRRERFEANYQMRARQGIEALIFVPTVLMLCMFVTKHKMLALTIWIITMMFISVVLLNLVYVHRKHQEMDGGEDNE